MKQFLFYIQPISTRKSTRFSMSDAESTPNSDAGATRGSNGKTTAAKKKPSHSPGLQANLKKVFADFKSYRNGGKCVMFFKNDRRAGAIGNHFVLCDKDEPHYVLLPDMEMVIKTKVNNHLTRTIVRPRSIIQLPGGILTKVIALCWNWRDYANGKRNSVSLLVGWPVMETIGEENNVPAKSCRAFLDPEEDGELSLLLVVSVSGL